MSIASRTSCSPGAPARNGDGDGMAVTPFLAEHARVVAGWVRGPDELRLVAPSTVSPLTAEKVLAWQRPYVESRIMTLGGDPTPRAYGELNRMRLDPTHCWLGHIVLDPQIRGRGWGRRFVGALVRRAAGIRRAHRVSLIVCPDNAAAIRCYERAGFDRVCEEYHRFGESTQRIRMFRYELYCGPSV